jgi:hypothetical protein
MAWPLCSSITLSPTVRRTSLSPQYQRASHHSLASLPDRLNQAAVRFALNASAAKPWQPLPARMPANPHRSERGPPTASSCDSVPTAQRGIVASADRCQQRHGHRSRRRHRRSSRSRLGEFRMLRALARQTKEFLRNASAWGRGFILSRARAPCPQKPATSRANANRAEDRADCPDGSS